LPVCLEHLCFLFSGDFTAKDFGVYFFITHKIHYGCYLLAI